MKLEDVRTFSDVLNNGPFEGETLYNKAYKYKRYDICLKITEFRRDIAEFEKNIRKYDETGLKIYKDKATGRYYHIIMWDEIIRRLREEDDVPSDADELKQSIIDELDLPRPSYGSCYACTTKCGVCPIAKITGPCSSKHSAYWNFVEALANGCLETAIMYAEIIVDAWIN